ncbi:hypothetical protein FOLKNPGA_01756 [Legionella sp. PC1000]|uniref:DUF4276 family protein n=1 Tax=Legionella sp. PC1000 TaxID=2746060 RepID=UPI0015FC4F32|nr:DUF4276 family protein [Legionella sp. PC1000]QLZ68976.1 hypothetical protein FOLKNPGA_01756 [Legionella sp. PC1000]
MHFEILVEDTSGKKLLDIIVPKIIGEDHTYKVHAYKGIGKIPKNLNAKSDPQKRILLTNLPKLLQGYGQTYQGTRYNVAIIVVCDLDKKNLTEFLSELNQVLNSCKHKPITRFCIAIEEGEAWFLGDIQAINQAYPKAKSSVLEQYVNDSICGTWEILADAIYPGGAQNLSKAGWVSIGTEKSNWAEKISPHMNLESNKSPSFKFFRDTLRKLIN